MYKTEDFIEGCFMDNLVQKTCRNLPKDGDSSRWYLLFHLGVLYIMILVFIVLTLLQPLGGFSMISLALFYFH